MDKKVALKNIIKCCETRFNRGASDDWKHSDFIDFSREIQKETKINISTNTLKRVFGKIAVEDDYLPQYATIDALKKYSGHLPCDKNDNELIKSKSDSNIFLKFGFVWSFSIGLLVVISLYFLSKNEDINSGTIKVSNTEGLLPKTAFFDLQIPKSEDSIFMDFGDKSPLIYLEPEQTKITHVYLFPGVFKVNFKSGATVLAESKISVSLNKWLGLGFLRQRDIPNNYYAFPVLKNDKDSLFYISNEQLHKSGLDTLKPYFTRLCNFTPLKNHSDNFIFETTFKKTLQKKGISCTSVQFQISGIDNIIRFNFVNSGCSSRVINIVSEQIFLGTKNDLSRFVLDLNQWNTVKLINRNKNLDLFVNGKLLFRGTYKQSIGDLRGVFVEFRGNGYVKKLSLKSLNEENLYSF
ncbi:hypothetical protein C3L50_02770 [Flavobacterium alvei]|uniref:Uncharacterized protein n=1 Tax=Flavobacterium alvei TaxID=2080416 RepID=A0A2S5AH58_9FLAO|nr:hypothetical protein [Flavobacterium alvei]POY41453.1 hypothetical protein C3L50_02770 [Flavobacterium alvei]